jgi:hypothetical protein
MVDIDLEGIALLTDPLLNKGSAFTEEKRTSFHLHGLLPPHVGTLDEQSDRRLKALRKFETNLERYLLLLSDSGASLLPPVSELRSVAMTIAAAVAMQAREEGLCAPFEDAALPALIAAKMWEPVYRPYRRKG